MSGILPPPDLLKFLSYACRARERYRRLHVDSRRATQHRNEFYMQCWRTAADHLGATVEVLGSEILEIRLGSACTRVRNNITALDDPVTVGIAADKPLVHQMLTRRGLRVPDHLQFTLDELGKAAAFMETRGGEWVVKPADSSGGRGVTSGIRRYSQMVRAAVFAAAYGSSLVLEQQVEGDVYRLLYLDGTLLDVVLRKTPTVVGDGRSSLRQLVHRENETRLNCGTRLAHLLLSIDTEMINTLVSQGLSLGSVPKNGAVVIVKKVINENSEADNVPAMALVCKSIIDDGAAAAATVGVRLAGVDVMTRQPGVPLAESGGVILEVNTNPGFYYHYHQQSGCPVVFSILERILRNRENVIHVLDNPSPYRRMVV